MRAVRHRERAAEMVFIFLKGHLRLLAEGNVPRSISSVTPEGEAKPAIEP
jgi:hypothetical protein